MYIWIGHDIYHHKQKKLTLKNSSETIVFEKRFKKKTENSNTYFLLCTHTQIHTNNEQFEKNFLRLFQTINIWAARKKRDKYNNNNNNNKNNREKNPFTWNCSAKLNAQHTKPSRRSQVFHIIANKEKHHCLEDFNIITSTFLFHIKLIFISLSLFLWCIVIVLVIVFMEK